MHHAPDRRAPPSFPTRRSSDLDAGGSPTIVGVFNENRGPSDGIVFVASALDSTGIGHLAATALIGSVNHLQLGWASASRSEDHTSELQSHVNLVCRLLLEKKIK